MQHKRQLGGNKWISKVRVFKSEKAGSFPYFLFYVDGATASGTGADKMERADLFNRPRSVRISKDGKHVVREHVMRVRVPKLQG
jgi:hypothetical protein